MIKHFRNQWAHNYSFNLRDAYRVADTVQLFFDFIQAPTDDINMLRLVILDALFSEEKEKISNQHLNGKFYFLLHAEILTLGTYQDFSHNDSVHMEEHKENPNEDDSGCESVKRHSEQHEKQDDDNEFTFSSQVHNEDQSFGSAAAGTNAAWGKKPSTSTTSSGLGERRKRGPVITCDELD